MIYEFVISSTFLTVTFLSVFWCYRLRDQDLSPNSIVQTKKALLQYFNSSSFMRRQCGNKASDLSSMTQINAKDMALLDLFVIPYKHKDESPRAQCESYVSSLWKVRDQVSFYAPFFFLSSFSPQPCVFLLVSFKESFHKVLLHYIRYMTSLLTGFIHELPFLYEECFWTWLVKKFRQDMGIGEELSYYYRV